MATIPILQTSSFVTFDPTKFSFVGYILEAMWLNVPTDNVIVNEYQKLPASGVRPVTEDLDKAIAEGTKAKRGGKRTLKGTPSKVVPNRRRSRSKLVNRDHLLQLLKSLLNQELTQMFGGMNKFRRKLRI